MSATFHFTRHGQQQGPVSANELKELVRSGQLLPSDHFWQAGMPAWLPIGQFDTSASGAAPPEPPPPPVQNGAPAAAPQVSGPSFVERCLTEVKETAGATAAHAGSLVQFGKNRMHLNTAEQQAQVALTTLGKRMYELGLGDAPQRERIHAAQERILSLQAAATSAHPVEIELRAEQVRLAETQLDAGTVPKGAEAEFQAAQTARQALTEQQQATGKSSEAIRTSGNKQTLRLAIGYGSIAMLLFMSLVAFGAVGSRFLPGGSPTPVPGPGDIVGPGPIDNGSGGGSGDNGDNGGGGYAPPINDQPIYRSPEPQFCYHCSGTGQANCNYCFGTGKKTCYQCNGTGRMQNFGNPNMQQYCFQCNGTGKQNCGFCQYGKVQCPQCLGRGKK